MIGLQPGHIVIIILIGILIFAPTRLYQLIRGFKGMFAQFRGEVGNKDKGKTAAPEMQNKNKS